MKEEIIKKAVALEIDKYILEKEDYKGSSFESWYKGYIDALIDVKKRIKTLEKISFEEFNK